MKIVILGAGKLAWHLAPALVAAGHELPLIYNRTLVNAREIAGRIGVTATDQMTELPTDADLYLIAVRDKAIKQLSEQLATRIPEGLVVHCSGATPASVLADQHKDFGVFYPLQSFTKEKSLDFRNIPICVDAQKPAAKIRLLELAHSISDQVYEINDAQRTQLHVAAVFVNNFVNHLYGIGQDLLQRHEIPFDILHPIIREGAEKILAAPARDIQTGPAVRSDWETIKRHEAQLKEAPDYLELYQLLTQSIIRSTIKK